MEKQGTSCLTVFKARFGVSVTFGDTPHRNHCRCRAAIQCCSVLTGMVVMMQGLADVPVIHFDTMTSAFGGHADFGDASR